MTADLRGETAPVRYMTADVNLPRGQARPSMGLLASLRAPAGQQLIEKP